MKICPKCETPHEKQGTYCSYKCSNSRQWNESDKLKKSISAKNSEKVKIAANIPRSQEQKDKIKIGQIEAWNKKLFDTPWDNLSYELKRKRVKIEQNNCCKRCGLSKWCGETLVLELDHKNGNHQDNLRENLEALCPNCHSLTPTWRGKNTIRINKISHKKVEDEELIFAIKNTKNLSQALISVGLSPRGNNYKRLHELKYKYGL